jgi:hypothetical protein
MADSGAGVAGIPCRCLITSRGGLNAHPRPMTLGHVPARHLIESALYKYQVDALISPLTTIMIQVI